MVIEAIIPEVSTNLSLVKPIISAIIWNCSLVNSSSGFLV
nr:MAG TPA: hypothetical protein [Caudoviricetes sp.]